MSILTDLRPFARGMRLGYQTLTTIFANIFALEDVISAEHDEETGEHRTRKVACATATYSYDSGSGLWVRQGGVGPLPATATRPDRGIAVIAFTEPIASSVSDYDVLLTCSDDSGDGTIINWRARSTTSITVSMLARAEGTGRDETFTIEIKKAY